MVLLDMKQHLEGYRTVKDDSGKVLQLRLLLLDHQVQALMSLKWQVQGTSMGLGTSISIPTSYCLLQVISD